MLSGFLNDKNLMSLLKGNIDLKIFPLRVKHSQIFYSSVEHLDYQFYAIMVNHIKKYLKKIFYILITKKKMI